MLRSLLLKTESARYITLYLRTRKIRWNRNLLEELTICTQTVVFVRASNTQVLISLRKILKRKTNMVCRCKSFSMLMKTVQLFRTTISISLIHRFTVLPLFSILIWINLLLQGLLTSIRTMTSMIIRIPLKSVIQTKMQ